jgi:hypothetical protein
MAMRAPQGLPQWAALLALVGLCLVAAPVVILRALVDPTYAWLERTGRRLANVAQGRANR